MDLVLGEIFVAHGRRIFEVIRRFLFLNSGTPPIRMTMPSPLSAAAGFVCFSPLVARRRCFSGHHPKFGRMPCLQLPRQTPWLPPGSSFGVEEGMNADQG